MDSGYDVLVIGLGPAGMAVAVMAAEMGLSVCAVEREHVGGECMNVGCIPSKALLRMGKKRALFKKLLPEGAENTEAALPDPFAKIARDLDHISTHKTMGMFGKVQLVYKEGGARFLDARTVAVGGQRITARKIFICTGTHPAVPEISGLREVQPLTNDSLFHLEKVPASMMILGSGAIACEMAQAFSRMGCRVSMVFRGKGLMWREDRDATTILEEALEKDGVTLYREAGMASFRRDEEGVHLSLKDGREVVAAEVLCALGRHFDGGELDLDKAGVAYTERGIKVDKYLCSSNPDIYACGDVNGEKLFSHAAMHQGMLALMNCMAFPPFKKNFRAYPVPWTIFTEPQISRTGRSAAELDKAGIRYETVRVNYADYGAAIAEDVDTGFVKVFVSKWGRVYGALIVGEGSGEMINEWTAIIQHKIRLTSVMMQQHSFPTMGFLSKRVAEVWMMGKMKCPHVRKLCQFLFRRGKK